MALKEWVGEGAGKKWNTAGEWNPAVKPAVASDVEFLSTKNNACEIDPTAGVCRSLVTLAGYTAKITSKSTAVLKIGTTTGTGTALKLTTEVTWEPNTATVFEFVSTVATAEKITCAGKSLPTVMFIGEGSKYQLADAFAAKSLAVVRGTFETLNQTVATTNILEVTGTEKRSVKLGSSTVKVGSIWDAAVTTELTWDAGTSTIELVEGSSQFKGGGLPYNNLTITASGERKVEGANTFATVAVNNKEATAKKGCKFQSGVAQTMTALTTNGASGKLARIESTVEGERHKLKKAATTVELKYTYIQDSEAEGGATWIAGEGCVDGGNNVGWSFEGAVTTISGVAKIKIKQASATEVLYAAAGTTKATFKTADAVTPLYSVQSAAKVRFATAGALSTTVLLAGTTKVTFTDSLFVKVTKEGEEGRKVVFLIVDE